MALSQTRGIYLKKGIYWLQLPQAHGIRPKPITLQTRDLTEAIARAVQVRKMPGLVATGSLKDEITIFLRHKVERRAYSASTAKIKRYTLDRFADWLPAGTPLHLITREQMQDYYNEALARSCPATAHKALMGARAFLRWALEVAKKIRSNPAVGVQEEPVPDSARPRFCSQALQDKLIDECPREDLKLVLMLGFHAGMRKNEIIQAVPGWFHFDRRCIDMQPTPTMPFNKHKKPRVIPMRRVLFDFLQTYGLREPFMLRPEVKQGKDTYRYDFDSALQAYVKKQKAPWVTAHVMRHTFASLLVQENTSIFKVAQWMGNTVSVCEKHYAHLRHKDDDVELRGVQQAKRAKRRKPKQAQGSPPP